jgi:Mn-dependent DtxR family transcriptional regulator
MEPTRETEQRSVSASVAAARAADILALGRAALDVIGRALRSSPEVRSNRVMARWPLDLEDLLLELEPMQQETPITELAARLGVSTAQLRSTALRLQRLALVKVSSAGVSLTATGRQKLARLEMARAAVLRRIARGFEVLDNDRSRVVIEALGALLEQAERVVDEQLGSRPSASTKPEARRVSPPPRSKSNAAGRA